MSTLIRWCKFNMVGTVGMVFQLTMLAVFLRWTKGHYLFATAAAIELTLVHNFVWHLNFTWRDRRDSSALVCQFLRFNASNGAVSILGNLAVMRVLVQGFRARVLVANCFAILACSVINFCIGHKWAFATTMHAASIAPVK
jgi:putative flippase GtrA